MQQKFHAYIAIRYAENCASAYLLKELKLPIQIVFNIKLLRHKEVCRTLQLLLFHPTWWAWLKEVH